MTSSTKAVVLVAALAGLVTGCATHPKQECKRCVSGSTSDKVSCSTKGNCGAKNGCGGKNGCSSKKGS
ncbi:MAG TPA: hypothetical protein VHY22_08625 [Chthoniobacteraceae bacterium]|jgi:hypothetical protein|nr:hypothetical protein [Chthoniobacteraceae bacterium]